jgi:hypothetical protein
MSEIKTSLAAGHAHLTEAAFLFPFPPSSRERKWERPLLQADQEDYRNSALGGVHVIRATSLPPLLVSLPHQATWPEISQVRPRVGLS